MEKDGDVIRVIEIDELGFTGLYHKATSVQQASHEVVYCVYHAVEEVRCKDGTLLVNISDREDATCTTLRVYEYDWQRS